MISEYRVMITTLIHGGTTMATTTFNNTVVIDDLQCDTAFFCTVSAFAFAYSDLSNVTHFRTSKRIFMLSTPLVAQSN